MGSMEFGRFPELLELGATVALGSDSAMSSNYVDIVRQMSLASGAAKSQRLDPTIMPPETVLEMATLHGSRALLWDDQIGSIAVGKKADITMFDTIRPDWQPVLNPLANLVHSSRGGADTVICNGKVLMERAWSCRLTKDAPCTKPRYAVSALQNSQDCWTPSNRCGRSLEIQPRSLSLQRPPILNRFRHMRLVNMWRLRQIGNGAGDFQCAVAGAGGPVEALHGVLQQLPAGFDRACSADRWTQR